MRTDCLVVSRADLPAHFGPGADQWGFRISAILSSGNVEHSEIELLFSDGTLIQAPGSKFRSSGDAAFGNMLAEFTAASARGGRALEIGSRARSGRTYRDWVHPSVDYVGLDITSGENVTVVGDAHHLSRSVAGKFDFVFSVSVFEHLLMPWKVAIEMNKVMNDDGLAYIQSHAAWPLHEEPWDFWRYSKDAWNGIFNLHTGFVILDKGYAMRCLITPDFAAGGHLQGLDSAPSYLLSACLVKKIGSAKVDWACEVSEVYDLSYDHR